VSPDAADDLYGLPLAEFTAARNKLAKESGDAAVGKLKKPSKQAWALNQAARSSRGDVGRFLHAADRVRAGGGRSALDELRTAEADVRRAAESRGGSVNEVNRLLAAAAADPDVGDRLRRGVLTGDEEASGLGMAGMSSNTPMPADDVREARERRRRQEAKWAAEKAADAAKDAAEHADRLERDAADAEEKATRLRALADHARAEADEARRQADELARLAEAARG
jgi:hypothetical protein